MQARTHACTAIHRSLPQNTAKYIINYEKNLVVNMKLTNQSATYLTRKGKKVSESHLIILHYHRQNMNLDRFMLIITKQYCLPATE